MPCCISFFRNPSPSKMQVFYLPGWKSQMPSVFLGAKNPRSGAWSKMLRAFLSAKMSSVFLDKKG